MTTHLLHNSSVEDFAEINGIDADGDRRDVLIVFRFDSGDCLFVVEEFVNGDAQDHVAYQDYTAAGRTFDRWVANAREQAAELRAEYTRDSLSL